MSRTLAVISLVLSVVSLIVYVGIIEGASAIVFAISTGGAFTAGVASLALGLGARKQVRRQEHKPKGALLATMSVVVATAYLVCISIVMLNIVIQWVL
jgi:hypothetical protein